MSVNLEPVLLGDVAGFVRGINFKPDDVVPRGTPGSVACMRTKNVQEKLDLSDVWYVREQFVRRNEQFLQQGDVLVSSANSWNLVGKCCWIPELPGRASFGGFVSVLRPDKTKIDPRFLYLWFSSNRIQIVLRSFGQKTTNISNLNIDRCLKLSLVLPPLPEQRRIAEILDRAEALRAERSAALAQLDSLTQSIFLDLFGDPVMNPKAWPLRKLGDVGQLDRGVSKHRPRNAPELLGGPYPLVQTGEVANCDGYIREQHGTYSEIGLRQSKMWPAGTLCITIAANIAKTGILTFASCFPDSIVGFRAEEAATVEFVRTWLSFLQKTLEDAAPESAQKNINLAILRNLTLPFPPIPLQQDFARRISSVEKLKVLQHASLVELDALFATLQHRAFRGELFQSDLRSNIAATPTAPDFRQHLKLDVDKGLEALIYVTGRTAEYDFYKALKTLYVADKDHLKRQGRLIYGETHCAQKHGPVPQAAYDGAKFLNGEMLLSPFPEDALRAALRRTARQLIPLRQPDLSKLSASERESLDRAINICAPMSFEQLKNYTHDAAYLKTPPNAPIRVEDIVATFSGGA